MTRYISNPTGNLLSYVTNSTQDCHGGHAREHREEMRKIAEDAIKEIVPQMCAQIYNEAVTNLIGALQYDVETCVHVSVESLGEIFSSSKLEKVLSEKLMKSIMSKLDKSVFTLEL